MQSKPHTQKRDNRSCTLVASVQWLNCKQNYFQKPKARSRLYVLSPRRPESREQDSGLADNITARVLRVLQTTRSVIALCLQTAHQNSRVSIALPALGTGNLRVPADTACWLMYDELDKFSQNNAATTLKDVRFVVYDKDPQSCAVRVEYTHESYLVWGNWHLRMFYSASNLFLHSSYYKTGI